MSMGDVHAVLRFSIALLPSFLKILQGENAFVSFYRGIIKGIEMGTKITKAKLREFLANE